MRNTGSKYDLASKDDLEALSLEFETALASFGQRLTQAERRVTDETHLRIQMDTTEETRRVGTDARLELLVAANKEAHDMELIVLTQTMLTALAVLNDRILSMEARTLRGRLRRAYVYTISRILIWRDRLSRRLSSSTSSSLSSSIPLPTDSDTGADLSKAWTTHDEQYPIF